MLLEKTKIFKVSPDLSNENDIETLKFASDILKKGGTVCFPTETVYGLGANALNVAAVKSIFAAKGRPQDNPLIIHLSDTKDIDKYCDSKNNIYFKKLSFLMPGPLTVILPKHEIIPFEVTAGMPNVAVRIPENRVARKLIELCGFPIAAPSANISGRPSPTCAKHVIDDLFGKVDVIIDSGESTVGLESTVISIAEKPILLRPGAVTYEQLTSILGEVDVSSSILSEMKSDEKAAAPGMKYKHYAPRTPVFLVMGDREAVIDFLSEKQKTEKCAVLCFDDDISSLPCKNLIRIGNENCPEEQAHRIFSALRKTDEIEDIAAVYVHVSKDKSGISLAVYNRLLKASAFHIIEV